MTRLVLFVSVFLGVGLVAVAYLINGFVNPAGALIILGLAWMVGLSRGRAWTSILGLFIVYGFASACFFLDSQTTRLVTATGINLTTLLLLGGGLFALLAWDLTDFYARLRLAADDDDLPALERRHFSRLLPVIALGMAASILALTIHVNISLEWMMVIALLGIIGMSKLINRLLRRE